VKIIHVIGHSGSGKTTFISKLIGGLSEIGHVASIKHLGHHRYGLKPGKDTTVFFEQGVSVSTGIDDEKTVMVIRDTDIQKVLSFYYGIGIDFTVVEGFKSLDIPSVIFGDLPAGKILFRNPSVDEVVEAIDRFPDFTEYLQLRS
jgi:molybdopterin synthase catalytic subunit